MRLLISPTSPYARKARVVLREKALHERIEEHVVNPHQDPAELIAHNPLGKIPALVTGDGETLYDSPVICEYLDQLGEGPALIPPSGPARWAVLRAQALADGVMDLAAATVMERARPEDEQSPGSVTRWRGKIERATDRMPGVIGTIPEDGFELGRIACAVALGYLDLRLPDFDWRAAQPALAEWHARVAARPSMTATAPPQG